jgi:PAS domain S-box-containing protein
LEEDEDWYRELVEHSHDLLCVHDLQGRFLSVNPVPARLLGYSVEEILRKRLQDVVDPRFRDQCDVYLREIERRGEFRGMIAVLTRSGEQRIWEYHNTLRTEGVERPIVRGIAHDVTERVLAEKALRASNEQLLQKTQGQEQTLRELTLFRTLLDQSTESIEVIDPETLRFLDVNQRLCTELGYSREELLSMTVADVDAKIDENRRARVPERLREKGFVTIETVHRRKDGSAYPVEVALREVQLDRTYVLAVGRDITDRKRAEQALRESEERFRLFVEHAPAALAMFDREMRYLLASPRWRLTYGLGDRDLRGVSHYDVFPEIPERWKEAHRRGLAGEVLRGEEDRFDRADGSVQWMHWEILPWHDDTGAIGGLVIFAEDVTERKRMEEGLRQSEERFRVALKNSPTAVFNQDQDLRYSWMYNAQLPFPLSETLGKTLFDLFDPEEAARITEVRRRVLETGVGLRDETQITVGGRKHYFDTTIEPALDSTGTVLGLTGASTDVTELREATEALVEAKNRLTEEKLYLEQEIDVELGFGEIIGRSKALQAVMENVGKVAASNATVLLLGETGTGKEMVARAIHRQSQRAARSFIKMNCAAIPSGLLESELFGNEKGAFTGSVSKKIGRVELADQGTLFLDEIGEISLALQPKLLRVLQDQEFERLGGIQTLKVDFRLIAATNCDLAESVREQEFRSDLYYRLNVFPIRLPPLRERREDIRLLVEHFVQKFARRMKRSITTIPKKTMDALMSWDWPGNVRELENFIERSVILTQGSVLVVPLSGLQPIRTTAKEERVDQSLAAKEREHIVRALQQSCGQIGGPKGAAARLGLKRTTLQSKLKHLGINPRLGPTKQ